MNQSHFKIENNIAYSNSKESVYKMVFLKEGDISIKIDFAIYEIKAPSLFFVSENQLVTVNKKDDLLKGTAICFSNDFFCIKLNRSETFCDAVIFNTTKPPYIALKPEEEKKINNLIVSIKNELNEDNEFQQDIIVSQLKTLLLYSSKIKLNQFGSVDLSIMNPLVKDFQDLLDIEYTKEHSAQFYSKKLNISPKGLNKSVKKELNRTVSDLIKEKLIIEAKRELYTRELSVKEIAFKLGFEDPAYFSRFFKKETSYSPKEYAELL